MAASSLRDFFVASATGQLISRVTSFTINVYFLRNIDPQILGLVNVRLTLLYTTLLFLIREPLRKTCLGEQVKSIPLFVNHLWLAPLLCLGFSVPLVPIWYFSTSGSVPDAYSDGYILVIVSFVLSAFIECLAEPFAVIAQKSNETRVFVVAQSLLILLQRVAVLAIISVSSISPLIAFCIAQVFASAAYLLFYLRHFWKLTKTRSFTDAPIGIVDFRSYFPSFRHGFDQNILKRIGTFLLHSVFKQVLTDGSGYVMTFTNHIGLTEQAVYDAIERLGSLVARIILAPLEESSYKHFSEVLKRDVPLNDQPKEKITGAVDTLKTLLRITTLISSVIICFGFAYSRIAVGLYGGDLLAKNRGGELLSLYLLYLFVMAINGITECFSAATMSNLDVFHHMWFLLFSAVGHLVLNIGFSSYFSTSGFIAANALNMVVRIRYSWSHIRQYLGHRIPHVLDLLPSVTTITLLIFSLVVTNLSNLIFGSTAGIIHNGAHIAIGGVMFLVVTLNIYNSEVLFQQYATGIQHQD
ncbi:hypothetical protein L596_030815 [Steinernema carpocapsae]|uniref:Protein RFT1 homolog n=1 Tax=Steinernema carpocapsae TaxID=34508 RepID=A0A4U5LNX0_STECR|nr:hypothetical protein L596_030815 [Steinernema carpocapsae]